MTALWIALYVVGGLVTVPVLARVYYDPDGGSLENSQRAALILALGNAWIWPIWAVAGAVFGIAHLLVPLVFQATNQKGGEQ